MSFLEDVYFPRSLVLGTTGGPMYSTSVIQLKSGLEKRNKNWSYPLHEYDVTNAIDSNSRLNDLITMFHAAGGRAYGFRFQDKADYKSCGIHQTISATDQSLGTGDNSDVTWQLKKTYTVGVLSQTRIIQKPVAGTVLVALNGTPTSNYTIDTTTGIITFTVAPGLGVAITAGFHFDVPCRFDSDKLSTDLELHQNGTIETILREIRI